MERMDFVGIEREKNLARLKSESFDLLVIGGGATGAGTALDAATRGLRVAWVEKDDFSAGSSSRSTKLIHGGVRYLEQAVKRFDRSQLHLVTDALQERAILLKIAPHLSRPLGLLTPLYAKLEIPYFLTGLKVYDLLAGQSEIPRSRYVSYEEIVRDFPMVKREGLKGGVLYYDGQFDDARMNVAIAITASERGAAVVNHVEVVGLKKSGEKISGAKLRDTLTNEEWETSARVVINATGPFSDSVRRMDDPKALPILQTSSGTHLVLGKKFSPVEHGILIPRTEDGRVVFILPWNGKTLVGTTDNPATVVDNPKPTVEDRKYILRTVATYFENPPKDEDVEASWTGLRPLVFDPKATDTARLSRDHYVEISPAGLLTVVGGKWTTYRKMGLDAVEQAIQVGKLEPKQQSWTDTLPLAGGENYSPKIKEMLLSLGLEKDVADHLAQAYGSRATAVMKIANEGYEKRIYPSLPYLEAEIVYGAKLESARTIVDILARRTRMSFLDKTATHASIPKVAAILQKVLGWSDKKRESEILLAKEYFQ
jgi:glycerol-3-phosphate dehydrogenase